MQLITLLYYTSIPREWIKYIIYKNCHHNFSENDYVINVNVT